jgi:hypothetical protein
MHDLLAAALTAVDRGWPVFILGRTKRPLANCPACRDTDPADLDPAACDCLTCHGMGPPTRDYSPAHVADESLPRYFAMRPIGTKS